MVNDRVAPIYKLIYTDIMPETNTVSHLVRITNCLQTILDLEPELTKLDLGHSLLDEFVVLKSFLQKIDEVELSEDDVQRIEQATSNFLKELREPLQRLGEAVESGSRLQ